MLAPPCGAIPGKEGAMGIEDNIPTWLKVLAGVLDFVTIFLAGGFVISSLLGQDTHAGFKLSGLPALVLMAVVVAYFWLLPRYTGSTLWQWILRLHT